MSLIHRFIIIGHSNEYSMEYNLCRLVSIAFRLDYLFNSYIPECLIAFIVILEMEFTVAIIHICFWDFILYDIGPDDAPLNQIKLK